MRERQHMQCACRDRGAGSASAGLAARAASPYAGRRKLSDKDELKRGRSSASAGPGGADVRDLPARNRDRLFDD